MKKWQCSQYRNFNPTYARGFLKIFLHVTIKKYQGVEIFYFGDSLNLMQDEIETDPK